MPSPAAREWRAAGDSADVVAQELDRARDLGAADECAGLDVARPRGRDRHLREPARAPRMARTAGGSAAVNSTSGGSGTSTRCQKQLPIPAANAIMARSMAIKRRMRWGLLRAAPTVGG